MISFSGDLERIVERAEEFEAKARDIENHVREQEAKVRETEAITLKENAYNIIIYQIISKMF